MDYQNRWSGSESLIQKTVNNPVTGGDLLDLHGEYNSVGNVVLKPTGPGIPEQGNSGIFIRTSNINHSCVAISDRISLGDLTMIHTTKSIAKGEEITLCYDPTRDSKRFENQMKHMVMDWNFRCKCPLYTAEAKCSPSDLETRATLINEAHSFFDTRDMATITRPAAVRMEKLVQNITATYDDKLHPGLPKTGLMTPVLQLAIVYSRYLRSTTKTREYVIGLFRAFAYDVRVRNGHIYHIAATANSHFNRNLNLMRVLLFDEAFTAYKVRDMEAVDNLLATMAQVEHLCHGRETESLEAREQFFG